MTIPRLPAVLLAVAVVLAACAPNGPTTTASVGEPMRAVTLLLGYRPDVQFAPFYVAQQEGYYADVGLEVTIEHKQAPDVQRLVADGQAEFGVADATDVMIARTSGIPIRYISTMYQSFPVALIGAAEDVPAEPSGLAGASIGTPGRFGSSWHALLAMLEAGGLTEEDVDIREYPQFNQVDGLANGDVELVTGFRNNDALRVEDRGVEVGLLTIDEVAPLPGPGVIAGDELLADEPDLVRAFAEATARAQAAVIADPEAGLEAARSAVSTIDEDLDLARTVLEATADLWAGDGFANGAIDLALWERGYAAMERLGFIDGSTPLDDMVAPDVLGSDEDA